MTSTKKSSATFYRGAPQEEALARLDYALESGLRMALLTGPAGCGKSTLLAEFVRIRKRRGDLVAMIQASDCQQLLWSLACQWSLFPDRQANVFSLWMSVTERIQQLSYEARPAAIVVDPLVADEAFATLLRQLAECHVSLGARLTIVGSLDAARLSQLPPQLKELVDLRVELEPWDEGDLATVVASDNFTPDAVDELHAMTGGIARQVGRLARFASLAAAAEQLDAIDADTLRAVQDELLLS